MAYPAWATDLSWRLEVDTGLQAAAGIMNGFPSREAAMALGEDVVDLKVLTPLGILFGLGYGSESCFSEALGHSGWMNRLRVAVGYHWGWWGQAADVVVEAIPSIGFGSRTATKGSLFLESINGPAVGVEVKANIGFLVWGPLGFRVGTFFTLQNYPESSFEFAGAGIDASVFARLAF
ncbi:MAG: hypothetical protein WCG80_13075 [Spirochaetales bacterium]